MTTALMVATVALVLNLLLGAGIFGPSLMERMKASAAKRAQRRAAEQECDGFAWAAGQMLASPDSDIADELEQYCGYPNSGAAFDKGVNRARSAFLSLRGASKAEFSRLRDRLEQAEHRSKQMYDEAAKWQDACTAMEARAKSAEAELLRHHLPVPVAPPAATPVPEEERTC